MSAFFETHSLYQSGPASGHPGPLQKIPDDLQKLLHQVGSSTYANGFFRFVPGAGFDDCFAPFGLNPSECFVFLKCAFGQLIFHHQGEYKALNPVFNCIDSLGDLDFTMNIMLCDRSALESSFFIDIYEQAFPSLGAPAVDELYAFVPALGLGGSRIAENVRRSKMQVEMAILTAV